MNQSLEAVSKPRTHHSAKPFGRSRPTNLGAFDCRAGRPQGCQPPRAGLKRLPIREGFAGSRTSTSPSPLPFAGPTIRTFAISFVFSMLGFFAPAAVLLAADYPQLKTDAEKFFADGSYAKARELYAQADTNSLPAAEARWVQFRLADTLWRAQAGTQTADSSKYEQAQQQLTVLVRDIQRVEDRDRVWVEVQESLGDFHWRRDNRNWGQAWQHYNNALDWWAGTKEIELARERYLQIVWKIASPPGREDYYYYGYYGNVLPLEILENVLKIAQSENDRAHAHYLIAMTIRNRGGDWQQRARVPEEFEAAIAAGKKTDWYDDALYNYAEWMNSYGDIIPLENGSWRQEADYVKALELFRRLVSEFKKGETRWYDQAKSQIENITKPVVSVGASHIFLPDSEIQFHLNWRNQKSIDLALYEVDLTRDVRFAGKDTSSGQWLQQIDLGKAERIKSWQKKTNDKGDYKPGNEAMRLDQKLPLGAYVIEAKGGGASARDLILVTDASVVLKTSGKQALVYFCNALDGSPLANSRVKLWERYYDDNQWIWREAEKETSKDGIAVFDLSKSRNHDELFVGAATKDRQAFSLGYSNYYHQHHERWRIYAFTDRPAYRPNETAQWKFIARQYDGSVYSTPAEATIEYEIYDPRGSKVHQGKSKLNAFGSAWGSLELTEQMPLGEYRIQFWDEGRKNGIGSATLFRLEEYKLPEFKVAIQTPEELVGTDRRAVRKAFRLGDKVEVNIQADYYFGGAVANATCEVLVYQNPFYHHWHRPYEFPWYYEDMTPQWQSRRYYGRGDGQIIKRETLKTDATGKATLIFDTPANAGQDFEYRIEARVTDASRREIVGSDTVRVTRQRYYVYPRAEHNLYKPQDKVTVEIKALDANEQPVETEGIVKVTRDYWFEIWLDPSGKEVKGEELKRARGKLAIFPPPPKNPGDAGWRLKFRGYEHDDILTRTVKTDTNGLAEVSFTPEREGYYRVAWTSEDKANVGGASTPRPKEEKQKRSPHGGASHIGVTVAGPPIKAETTVWVCTSATTDLGYRHGGLQIIVDKDTFRAGQKAPVMLVVPTNDRHVLFSVEGEDLYSYQLVHVPGTVKLVELDITEKHVPNIYLHGAMVSDRQFFVDSKQVVVPPTKHFLNVEVAADRPQYQPREEGTFTVKTTDHEGKPVAAEVAMSIVDESVFYIQQDYAGDPRQFYFGTKRQQWIQTQSTFQQKQYAKLVETEGEQLIDEKVREDRDASKFGFAGRYRNGRANEWSHKAEGAAMEERTASMPEVSRLGAAVAMPSSAPAAPPMESLRKEAKRLQAGEFFGDMQGGGGQEPAVVVRSDFRSTVLWQPDVVTDKDGKATVKVKYPDSLTGWKAMARVLTAGNQFGIADATTRTKQPLIVRLQAPRFFVVGDTVTISAVINNNTEREMKVRAELAATGPFGNVEWEQPAPVSVQANGEKRVDWVVQVKNAQEAKLKVTARADKYSDAMEKTYPVFEHGIEKFVSKSGKVRGDDVKVTLDIPKERKPESTTLTVQVAPSMAVTMLDALPYLIDYPYGCVEQTMSRFLPAAVTAKTLKDLGLEPADVMGKVFGGIEGRGGSRTTPTVGKEKDLAKLDDMVKKGLERLYDMQHSDGGWGWWKGGESDHFMTAYVVWGLTLAKEAGIGVRSDVVQRGVSFLDKEIVEEETNHDMQAWMLHALSVSRRGGSRTAPVGPTAKAFENLWTNKDKLNAYTRALLALSAHHFGYADKAKTLIENLENGVKIDERTDQSVLVPTGDYTGTPPSKNVSLIATAHWGEDGLYWRWSDGGVEATAWALKALLTIDPQHKLIEPVSNWLIKNRRGAQWCNTRDTAMVVLALNDYLRVTKELSPEVEYELFVNGASIVKKKLTAAEALSAPSRFEIDRKHIKDGANEIRIKRKAGKDALYFAAEAKFFSLEEPIPAAGNEIFVRRQYHKIVGRPTLLKGFVYDKLPLNDGESVTSGERVECVITIEGKNHYEYLVFEDLKPAGLEAVEVRSGENVYAKEIKSSRFSVPGSRLETQDYTGRTRWVYQELRDRKVALFIDKLPEGVWEIRYELRAEVPGKFHALPVLGHAMYVPEIRCNGAETRIAVVDPPAAQ